MALIVFWGNEELPGVSQYTLFEPVNITLILMGVWCDSAYRELQPKIKENLDANSKHI